MAGAMWTFSTRLIERFAREPGLADEIESLGAEIERQMRNYVPTGWTDEEEADAIGQAVRDFKKNVQQWAAAVRNSYG